MILLDTNVISQPLNHFPDRRVIAWIDSQLLENLYLSAIVVGEMRFGVSCMAEGKRKAALDNNLENGVLPKFVGRVLPFDMACTKVYAELLARGRRAGVAIETADACIAATAIANGFAIATRDVIPFQAAGLKVINPWEA